MSTDEARYSVLDLVDLSTFERRVWLLISREGPASVKEIAQALACPETAVETALVALKQLGRVRQVSEGQWGVVLGHISRHTTLPIQVWPAFLTTDRIYSDQEIATLRTAIPMLQFARAKLSEFTDHGPSHGLRVKSFATQLSYILDLTDAERHLLRAGALFHDIGNVVDRGLHNRISQETVEKLAAERKLPFTAKEAELVGLLCRWHRGEFEPARMDTLQGEPIRTGLLASILRVADAMDIDHRRSDYEGKFRQVLEFFFSDSLPHWTSLDHIRGVRIHCDPNVTLQVYTDGQTADNLQIKMLRQDLASTLLDWGVKEIDTEAPGPVFSSLTTEAHDGTAGRGTLLVFPFEAHSLVMAAISQKHLIANSCPVEPLCYPDTDAGSNWLWTKALPEIGPDGQVHLLVIGDRPDPGLTQQALDVVQLWQESGAAVSILNRHEANWPRIPSLIELGVEIILGGDWAYFWGADADEADLVWGRIAALCTRDPTQSTVGITTEEQAVTQGLLNEIYSTVAESRAIDPAEWSAAAHPLLKRIILDDRDYFTAQASIFAKTCLKAASQGRDRGKVVVFDQNVGENPLVYYWILESAIEIRGRMQERGIRFNVPYAIATWPDGDLIKLLAINHWREEEAIPIRLLYPFDLGPSPQGNECTIHVHLTTDQVKAVLPALTAACNRA